MSFYWDEPEYSMSEKETIFLLSDITDLVYDIKDRRPSHKVWRRVWWKTSPSRKANVPSSPVPHEIKSIWLETGKEVGVTVIDEMHPWLGAWYGKRAEKWGPPGSG